MNADDVGTYWLGPDGEVWQLVAYTDQPTATWLKVGSPGERRDAVVYSPLAREFRRLKPEDETSA